MKDLLLFIFVLYYQISIFRLILLYPQDGRILGAALGFYSSVVVCYFFKIGPFELS